LKINKKFTNVLILLLIVLLNFSFSLSPIKKIYAEDASDLFKITTEDSKGTFTTVDWKKSGNTMTHNFKATGWGVSDKNYSQNYALDSKNPIVKYECIETIATGGPEGGGSASSSVEILGTTSYKGGVVAGGAVIGGCKEKERYESYEMDGHKNYILALKGTDKIGLYYQSGEEFKKAEGSDQKPLSTYVKFINGNETAVADLTNIQQQFSSGNFDVASGQLKNFDKCGSAPEITIAGHDFGGGITRPTLTFKLTHVVGLGSENFFYFIPTDPKYQKDVALRFNDRNEGWFMGYSDIQNYHDDFRIGSSFIKFNPPDLWWTNVVNKVYNSKPTDPNKDCGAVTKRGENISNKWANGEQPTQNCINATDGWLNCWGVTYAYSQVTPTDGEGSECEAKCPTGHWYSITSQIQHAICQMQCQIINWMGDILGFFIETLLLKSLGI